ncbi:MAG: hypothetical protein KJ880_05885 [Candidatus Omnitrophica bacterium]|nr:hypothetical protein [Candidatus Omnitrophota bacterium]MBU1869848.1 hypothetical protein [Candidatus Omnitrophota bacterium]
MKKALLLIIPFLLFGCATQMDALQLRQLETKELEGTLDDAFRATMSVLQDAGYIIKNSDYQSGVIHAETGKKKDFWTGGTNWFEVTATVEQFTKEIVKERITILSKTEMPAGGFGGGGETAVRVENPELIQKLYADIKTEIFRRQNLAK